MSEQEIRFIDSEDVFGAFTTRITTAKERRAALAEQAAGFGGTAAWPHLVHGTRIQKLTEEDLGRGLFEIPDTDGCITDVPGIALTVTCGDCLPVYIYDPVKKAIGLAHAGWKGTLGGIAAELILSMQKEYGTDPSDAIAWVGPGISACCFKVKADCYEQFTDKYYWTEDFLYSWPDGTYTLDIKGINLELLQLCGVENISASPLCTCCSPDTFYSYRRCGDMDRMLAYLYLKGSPHRGRGTEDRDGFKPAIGLSRCLTGEACRYDGKGKPHPAAEALKKKYYTVPVCPEILGGLPTPRNASEIKAGRVMMKVLDKSLLAGMDLKEEPAEGSLVDVTKQYEAGAEEALRILRAHGAEAAVLKSKSPSCGTVDVYDGSFTRTLTRGSGVFARALAKSGILAVCSDDERGIEQLMLSKEEIKDLKMAMRKEVRAAEKAMAAEEKKAADKAITAYVLSLEEYKNAGSVFAFAGMAREIDTRALLEQILADGKLLYLPLCTGDGIMEAKRVDSLELLEKGAYGIMEPPACLPTGTLQDIGFAVIPCVSCSHSGKRLGQGGGFYDRFLADYKGPSVMICREALTREDIPVEPHDIKLTAVATDKGIFRG